MSDKCLHCEITEIIIKQFAGRADEMREAITLCFGDAMAGLEPLVKAEFMQAALSRAMYVEQQAAQNFGGMDTRGQRPN